MSIRAVVIAHPAGPWRTHFVQSLRTRCQGVYTCEEIPAAKKLVVSLEPELIVTELRLASGPTLPLLEWVKRHHCKTRTVVVTDHGSIATAVRCTRLGVDAYFCKPVSCEQVIGPDPADADPLVSETPMRLERAIWEYLHRVVDSAGSISRGALLLGVDRRSLRRMMGKYAPPT